MSRYWRCLLLCGLLGLMSPVCGLSAIDTVAPSPPSFSGTALPDGLETLSAEAFQGCTSLTQLWIPDSVTAIAPDAFDNTPSLTLFGLPDSVAATYAEIHAIPFVESTIALMDQGIIVSENTCTLYAAATGPFGHVTYDFGLERFDGTALTAQREESDPSGGRRAIYSLETPCQYTAYVILTDGPCRVRHALGTIDRSFPIALNATEVVVDVGLSLILMNDPDRTYAWTSSDPSVASVVDGVVYGQTPGESTISVVCLDDGAQATCTVTVVQPVTAVEIVDAAPLMYVGDQYAFVATVTPTDAFDPTVTWRSFDPDIASVDENGCVTALRSGVTLITAQAGRQEVSTEVEVIQLVTGIDVLPEREAAYPEEQVTMGTLIFPDDVTRDGVTWHSSDEQIASIDALGLVTAHKPGTVVITATTVDESQLSAQQTFTVWQPVVNIVLVSPVGEAAYVGEPFQLSAYTLPENAHDPSIVWTSSHPEVATVDADGNVTPRQAGESVLTATTHNGLSLSTSVTVRVKETKVYSLLDTMVIAVGQTGVLRYIIEPENATDTTMTWTSSDERIVSIRPNGRILGVASGSAQVTGTSAHGQVCTLSVTVVGKNKGITGITLDHSSGTLYVGGTASLHVTSYTPSSPAQKQGIWWSNRPDIVAVDAQGTLTALAPGEATVYAVANSGAYASCVVTVRPIRATGLTLDRTSVILGMDETVALLPTLQPANVTDPHLTWSSSDETVATVDANGWVRAVDTGTATVTVRHADGLSASVTCTVRPTPIESLILETESLTGIAGQSQPIRVTLTPARASLRQLRWSSADPTIAAVSSTGEVTFVRAGETTITCETTDGSALVRTVPVVVTEIRVEALTVDASAITLDWDGDWAIPYRIVPENASFGAVTFQVADEYVAYVSDDGVLHARTAGTTRVTLSTDQGRMAQSIDVTVRAGTTARYRALITGEFTDPDQAGYLPFSVHCTQSVADSFSLSRVYGTPYEVTVMSQSPTKAQILSAIYGLSAVVEPDDVTMIFLLAHGIVNEGEYKQQISSEGTVLSVTEVLSAVRTLPGHVMVVFCSCRSGVSLESAAAKALMNAAGTYTTPSGDTGTLSILCAATETIASYHTGETEEDSYDFYTQSFLQGLGYNMITDTLTSAMPADDNRDGMVTIRELASYVRSATVAAIARYLEYYGTSSYWGSPNQTPSSYVSEPEVVIYARRA